MIALHESLVEWTALALGFAVAAALLLRIGGPLRKHGAMCAALLCHVLRPLRHWLHGVALLVIVANAGIAVNAAAAAARSEAAGAWNAWAASAAWTPVRGAAAVRVGAIAAAACLVILLAAWLFLSRSLRVLPSASRDEGGDVCCADCPECVEAGLFVPTENQGRKRARGLTVTRLGGG